MRALGNVIWFIFVGWWAALGYLLIGVICCITIIGIPIGKAMFQYAKLMAFPFGKEIVKETFIKGKENVSIIRRFFGTLANIIWLPVGIVLFILNIFGAVGAFLTIIFIPYGVVLIKCAKFNIWPIGAKVITKEEKQAILTASYVKKQVETTMDHQRGVVQQNNYFSPNIQGMPEGMSSVTPNAVYPRPNFSETPGQAGRTAQNVINEPIFSKDVPLEGFNNQEANATSASIPPYVADRPPQQPVSWEQASRGNKAVSMGQGKKIGNYFREIYHSRLSEAKEKDRGMYWADIMTQLEAANFRNPVTAAIMAFLPWICGCLIFLLIIGGIFSTHSFLRGIFYGLENGGGVIALCGILFMFQKKYTISAICFFGGALSAFIGFFFTETSLLLMVVQIAVLIFFGILSILLTQE